METTQTYESLYKELCTRLKTNCKVENEILDVLKGIREDRRAMALELSALDELMERVAYLDSNIEG